MIGSLRRRQRLWILWLVGLPLIAIWGMGAWDAWHREGRLGLNALLFGLGLAGLIYETLTEWTRRETNHSGGDRAPSLPEKTFKELDDGLLALSLDAHQADLVASVLRGLDIPLRLENQNMAAITQFPLFFKARLVFPAEHREAVEQVLLDLDSSEGGTFDEMDFPGEEAEEQHAVDHEKELKP